MANSKNKVKKTIEMRTEDATKWLSALRSDKYTRANGTLVDEEYNYRTGKYETCGHCCFGVLQDVLGKVQTNNDLPTRRWLKDHKIKVSEAHADNEVGRNVQVDIRLDPPYEGYDSVAELNDSNKYSFKQIAAILDKRIKRV